MAAHGRQSVAITIDGSQDDGTAWVQQPVDLADVGTLSVAVYSPRESFNTLRKVAAYAGPMSEKGALSEAEFDTDEAVEDHSGWKTYTYPVGYDGEGLVAVGVSVVWETTVTRHVDDVELS